MIIRRVWNGFRSKKCLAWNDPWNGRALPCSLVYLRPGTWKSPNQSGRSVLPAVEARLPGARRGVLLATTAMISVMFFPPARWMRGRAAIARQRTARSLPPGTQGWPRHPDICRGDAPAGTGGLRSLTTRRERAPRSSIGGCSAAIHGRNGAGGRTGHPGKPSYTTYSASAPAHVAGFAPRYACTALEALPPWNGGDFDPGPLEGTGPDPSRARGRLSGEPGETQVAPGSLSCGDLVLVYL